MKYVRDRFILSVQWFILTLSPALRTLPLSVPKPFSKARTDTEDTSLVSTVLCPYTPLSHSATLALQPTLYTSSLVRLGLFSEYQLEQSPGLTSCTPCTARLLLYSLYSSTTPVFLVRFDCSSTPCTVCLHLYPWYGFAGTPIYCSPLHTSRGWFSTKFSTSVLETTLEPRTISARELSETSY